MAVANRSSELSNSHYVKIIVGIKVAMSAVDRSQYRYAVEDT
jgi:hypothetical protein